jgi:uncharacterized SAM-binding protein YcdF (DUF218 family)
MPALRSRFFVLVLAALVILLAAGAAFVDGAARWLNNPDAPSRADAILVLAGSYQRPIHAGDLYRQGFAPLVLVSVAVADPAAAPLAVLGVKLVPKEETYEQTLRAKGVPAERIQRLGTKSLSTVDEAHELRKRYAGKPAKVLVVTSPFHVRRSRMIFTDALEGSGVSVSVLATPQEPFPERWWTSQDAARDVLLEWTKILFYLGGGRFRAPAAS